MVDLAKRRFFTRQKIDTHLVRLPWLKDAGSFTQDCTRCSDCLNACETHIIVKGDGGFPTIDFSKGECTFCYRCAEACPESLFSPEEQLPWQAKAEIQEGCLAHQQVECRSCGDMCEPMAIQFKLSAGRVAMPVINVDECNGCGACVAVCPSSAIRISNKHLNTSEMNDYGTK